MAWPAGATDLDPGDLLVFVTAIVYAVIIVDSGSPAPSTTSGSTRPARSSSPSRRPPRPTPPDAVPGRPEAFFAAEVWPLCLTPTLLLAILCMGILASVVTSLVQTWAQARMPAVHAAVIFALEPVFTALFAAVTLGERLSRASGGAEPSSSSGSSYRSSGSGMAPSRVARPPFRAGWPARGRSG